MDYYPQECLKPSYPRNVPLDSGPITPTIFSLQNEALRIGPQVLLIFNFDPTNLPPDWSFLKNWSIQLTNHESWDQDSAKQYTWSAVAINYTFDNPCVRPPRMVALSFLRIYERAAIVVCCFPAGAFLSDRVGRGLCLRRRSILILPRVARPGPTAPNRLQRMLHLISGWIGLTA